MRLALILLGFSLASTSFAADIFVTSEGAGNKTGENWSNALKGSLDGYHLAVKTAIDNAVAGGADEVNVYFAGGDYSITQQLSLASISIPVNLRGGYLAEADGSLEKGETATTFTRTANYVRHISASALPALCVEGITFKNGYVNVNAARGGAVYLASSTTVITNCCFTGNQFYDSNNGANSFSGGGAVAAVTAGSLDLVDCTFSGNYRSGGNANNGSGGALYANSVNLKVRGCTFSGNYLDGNKALPHLFGGAIGTYYGNVTISNCTFIGNYIRGPSKTRTGSGGALAIRNAKNFLMSNSTFTGNYVGNTLAGTFANSAGIMLVDDLLETDGLMTSVVERCVFDSRTVPDTISPPSGSSKVPVQSDMLVSGGRLFMTNCVIFATRGNHDYSAYSIRCQKYSPAKKGYGGYSYTTGSGNWTCAPCSLELVNCTIADGKTYGAVAVGGAEMTLKNCISYGHSVSGVVNATSVEYCCLQEEHEGEGNFVPESKEELNWTGAPYYHLLTKKSNGAITNGWFGGTFESAKTAADSLCIDAGAAGFPVGLEPEPNGKCVNLGAYGGTQWASMTSGTVGLSVIVR